MDHDRDNSPEAILARYKVANSQAVVTYNEIMFDSLRDIFYLLNQVKDLQAELAYNKKEIK